MPFRLTGFYLPNALICYCLTNDQKLYSDTCPYKVSDKLVSALCLVMF